MPLLPQNGRLVATSAKTPPLATIPTLDQETGSWKSDLQCVGQFATAKLVHGLGGPRTGRMADRGGHHGVSTPGTAGSAARFSRPSEAHQVFMTPWWPLGQDVWMGQASVFGSWSGWQRERGL